MMYRLLETHPVDGGRFGSKSGPGQFSGGGRGGGGGTEAMNSCVKGAMGWLLSSSETATSAVGCSMVASDK